jgi:hypothetical protein
MLGGRFTQHLLTQVLVKLKSQVTTTNWEPGAFMVRESTVPSSVNMSGANTSSRALHLAGLVLLKQTLVGLGFPVLVVSLFIPCTAPRCVLSLLLTPL